jgi:hypothetical protein
MIHNIRAVQKSRDRGKTVRFSQYPSLSLADVYQMIGYCLRHSSERDAYLAQRRNTRGHNESTWPADGIRDRLLARRRA